MPASRVMRCFLECLVAYQSSIFIMRYKELTVKLFSFLHISLYSSLGYKMRDIETDYMKWRIFLNSFYICRYNFLSPVRLTVSPRVVSMNRD
jgi:hypothetical protein